MTASPSDPSLTLPAPVLLVEDDPLIRRRLEGLMKQLGYPDDALMFAMSLAQARERLADGPIALALVDLGLPDGSGIDLIQEMHAADPALSIVVISAWSTEDVIFGALRAGATGYILKERDDLEVMLSIRSVLRGGAPIDPFVARRIIDELKPRAPTTAAVSTPADAPRSATGDLLTARETQILKLIVDGLANREIAERLFVSRFTVESHVKHIYRKLAVTSRARAIHTAHAQGLLR